MSTAPMNILVGIDFSECSNLVMSQAVKLVGQTGARLHLGYVAHSGEFIRDVTLRSNIPDDFPEAQKALVDLQRLQAQLGPDINTELHVRLSMSAQEGLLGLIMELKPDLVIVGSHGKGAFKRALLGSVCHQLSLNSPVPILIVPAPGREQLLNEPRPGT